MRRLIASAVALVVLGGCSADRLAARPTIKADSGVALRYDRCTFQAFTAHTSPQPCYRLLGVQR